MEVTFFLILIIFYHTISVFASKNKVYYNIASQRR